MKYNAEELRRARDEFVIAAQWCDDILSGEKKPTRANIEGCIRSADRTAGVPESDKLSRTGFRFAFCRIRVTL